MLYILEQLEDDLWSAIHILCRTFNTIPGDDIKYLKCFILSMFYLIPIKNYDYTRFAVMYMYSYDINTITNLGVNNTNLVKWSIQFRNFMNRQFGIPTIDEQYIDQKFAHNNLYKNVWGPIIWNVIHMFSAIADLTFNYIKYKAFITCIPYVLPCMQCRLHFKEHLLKYPLDVSIESKDVFQWSVVVHNDTNVLVFNENNDKFVNQGKTINPLFPLKDAKKMYFTPLVGNI